jgi:hypothetical protein
MNRETRTRDTVTNITPREPVVGNVNNAGSLAIEVIVLKTQVKPAVRQAWA